MILTAHQPVYLPWLGLFHKIALADLFCYFDRVQYQIKGWNNRNKIKFSNGNANWLSVPVLNAHYRKKFMVDLKINSVLPWKRKHLKSIELNYNKAKYFNDYYPELRTIYEKDWDTLTDLNYEMLLLFLQMLNINVRVVKMSDYSFEGVKSDMVLDMCLTLGADSYIFGELGRDYANISKFRESGVIPYFQEYKHPTYFQMHGGFISHLSVIDLLFNCGPDSLDILMSANISLTELESWITLERKSIPCP